MTFRISPVLRFLHYAENQSFPSFFLLGFCTLCCCLPGEITHKSFTVCFALVFDASAPMRSSRGRKGAAQISGADLNPNPIAMRLHFHVCDLLMRSPLSGNAHNAHFCALFTPVLAQGPFHVLRIQDCLVWGGPGLGDRADPVRTKGGENQLTIRTFHFSEGSVVPFHH